MSTRATVPVKAEGRTIAELEESAIRQAAETFDCAPAELEVAEDYETSYRGATAVATVRIRRKAS